MYWFLLLTLVVLSQELSVERWNGLSWELVTTCPGGCMIDVTINTAESYRVSFHPEYLNNLSISSRDALEHYLEVYAKLGAVASNSSYDAWYSGSTPVNMEGGECGIYRYYYIVNLNAPTPADLSFNLSEIRCFVPTRTASTTSSFSTIGISTTSQSTSTSSTSSTTASSTSSSSSTSTSSTSTSGTSSSLSTGYPTTESTTTESTTTGSDDSDPTTSTCGECFPTATSTVSSALLLTTNWIMILGLKVALIMVRM